MSDGAADAGPAVAAVRARRTPPMVDRRRTRDEVEREAEPRDAGRDHMVGCLSRRVLRRPPDADGRERIRSAISDPVVWDNLIPRREGCDEVATMVTRKRSELLAE